MRNRFLIVCGGSGIGLLGKREVLGLLGEIQLDVSDEIKRRKQFPDPRFASVALEQPILSAQRLLYFVEQHLKKSDPDPIKKHSSLNSSSKKG